jgi:hypothetical protein
MPRAQKLRGHFQNASRRNTSDITAGDCYCGHCTENEWQSKQSPGELEIPEAGCRRFVVDDL